MKQKRLKEVLLHYLWKNRVGLGTSMKTTCGLYLKILHPGKINRHSGPDFLTSSIRISSLTWYGNVEIHLNGSDWKRHGHHLDPAYDNVILHVVASDPVPVSTSSGRSVPVLVLSVPEESEYWELNSHKETHWLICHPFILSVSGIEFQGWLTRLMQQREEEKTRRIFRNLEAASCSWEECLHLALVSAMGLPVNRLPMEMALSGIPFDLLLDQRESRTALEAMLFGQAGLLFAPSQKSVYRDRLLSLYSGFEPRMTGPHIQYHLWKFLRLRPSSFPTLRISQMASLIHLRYPLLDSIIHSPTLTDLAQLLRVKAGEYWNTHYLFGKPSPEKEKYLGEQSVNHLIINALIPVLLAMGECTGSVKILQTASSLLMQLEAESNSIIREWASMGIKAENAFESQALLELYEKYCKRNRCLECMIGRKLLQTGIKKACRQGVSPLFSG